MSTTPSTPKKDFWAPFRTDFKTFLSMTRKAFGAGITTAVGTTGATLGTELTAAATSHTAFDLSANLGGLALTFVGAFIGGFATSYALSNAS